MGVRNFGSNRDIAPWSVSFGMCRPLQSMQNGRSNRTLEQR
jgi:hypothetical protein